MQQNASDGYRSSPFPGSPQDVVNTSCRKVSAFVAQPAIPGKNGDCRSFDRRLRVFPFLKRHGLVVELIADEGIGVAAHATDCTRHLLVDMETIDIDGIVANIKASTTPRMIARAGPTCNVV